jgi:hypothetical protein
VEPDINERIGEGKKKTNEKRGLKRKDFNRL